jgi:hypothetical protein
MLVALGCGDGGSNPADGSASVGETADAGSAEGSSSGPVTGGHDTAGTGTSASASADTTAATEPTDDGIIFDVGTLVDAPAGDCECGQASSFSYIFIANSPESTVSKIDTLSVTEVGRYLTRADAAGNPSRTSVSISGRAVAVANRHGGLIKIFANETDCIDANGNGVIDSSTGAADVRAWDQDECVHWYRDFPGWTVQRPVAWAPGTFDPVACRWDDEVVWTAGCGGGFQPGFGGDNTTHVHLIDGETGLDVQTVDLADYSCQGFGPYGGAVDSEGNFWLLQNNGFLARVDRDDFTHQVWPHSANTAPYGLTVDSVGRPWVTSYSAAIGAARFDPATETWAEAPDPVLVNNGQSGIAQGADGRIWMGVSAGAGGLGVASIDPETLAVVDVFAVPGVQGKGISVDGEGYVWRAGGSTATKIDPDDGSSSAYVGLSSAYTYSDMTGFGVANASGCNPAG